jgi:predicted dehydrogenase
MSSSLRAGVIGAGVFGGYHAAKWAAFEGVSLSAVHDPDRGRAAALAGRHGAAASPDAAAFFEAVDIVSIASPAVTHARWALAALKAGKPVYVEKPMTTDLAEADALTREASRRGLVLACGFQERIAFRAIGLFAVPEAPRRLEATRLGPRSPRARDVSVVLDLMIHDLDLALAIGAGEPFAVEAEGSGEPGDGIDEARAEVTFDDGFTAIAHASRVAAAPERSMRIVYPSGEVRIDFMRGFLENATPFSLDTGFAATADGRDRLQASLREFRADGRRPGRWPGARSGACGSAGRGRIVRGQRESRP